MVESKQKISHILGVLQVRYPDVKTQLVHKSPFQLLVATILSAQCTDSQVNRVTPVLFGRYPGPLELAGAPLEDIKSIIFSTGFFNNKAKNIKACAGALLEHYGGKVPDNMEELLTLPGVGRKTANVVLSSVFNTPAIVVDTHVQRISRRLGLTGEKDPVRIEFDLMKKIPRSAWSDFSLWLIYFGRQLCTARAPVCGECPLDTVCPFYKSTCRD